MFQIVKLEQDMLKVLDFQLVQPTIRTFMTRYLEISHLDAHSDQIEYLSNVSNNIYSNGPLTS